MINYKKLQNGSDIRGVAIEIPNGRPVDLNMESTTRIGSAFAAWVAKRLHADVASLRIAIGRDSRLTGYMLTEWLACGINSVGANAFDGGMASTPAMFMCCVNELQFDASIMVTASHLPMERNGMKFFLKHGGLEKADISEILAMAENASFTEADNHGEFNSIDIMTPYLEGLKTRILSELGCTPDEKPFDGLHIVVDAGNGAGGFFAERLLLPLGANISGSRFLDPDGNFPNHQPNPENAEAMNSICDAVLENNADFGIIFDTDVDRAGAVLPGENGVIPLDRNRLIAMMSAILAKQYGQITVVTDSITSTGLADFIGGLGCRHHRFKRGYRNVINEAKRLITEGENAILAMETSGHGALKENYFLDDGAYIILKLLVELVRARRNGITLNSLICGLAEPTESAEARLNVLLEDTKEYTASVLDHVNAYFADLDGYEIVQPNFEGIRVNADKAHGDGWFLIRRSLHDPIMPCNLESNSIGGLSILAQVLYNAIKEFGSLDTEPLKKLI